MHMLLYSVNIISMTGKYKKSPRTSNRVEWSRCCVHETTVTFAIKQATEDSNNLIAATAIEASHHFESVIVISEDNNSLVVFILHESHANIYFLKPGKGKFRSTMYAPHSTDLVLHVEVGR